MSLPPEQINIKRRRVEEPVETLFIQSELHQTKRRFTDFVFQRVLAGNASGNNSSGPSPPVSAAQRTLRTPRSVSSLNISSTANATRSAPGQVPLVRATSPGAEFREQKRQAAARKEAEEKFTRAVHSTPQPVSTTGDATPSGRLSAVSGQGSITSSPNPLPMRKFQISRSSKSLGRHISTRGGVQKQRGDSVSGVAVLVEKLKQIPHSRMASMVTDLLTTDGTSDDTARIPLAETPARSRKRPIVNQAERRWREERQNNISTAKQRIARMADRGDSDDESERLAQQLEQVALDLEGGMDTTATETRGVSPPRAKPASAKPPLKYQPRVPSKPRAGAATQESGVTDAMQPDAAQPTPTSGPGKDDDDDDYVYDTYIRQPLPSTQFPNPLASLETNQDAWFRQNGIDTSRPDVGIIVITPEDEQYWENFVEDDDEDRWDSEDADSNAENNPANDYPDEDLSWDDEDDDPNAIYSKYRDHAASDDEEFDLNDSASEGDRFEY